MPPSGAPAERNKSLLAKGVVIFAGQYMRIKQNVLRFFKRNPFMLNRIAPGF